MVPRHFWVGLTTVLIARLLRLKGAVLIARLGLEVLLVPGLLRLEGSTLVAGLFRRLEAVLVTKVLWRLVTVLIAWLWLVARPGLEVILLVVWRVEVSGRVEILVQVCGLELAADLGVQLVSLLFPFE